ncbi:TPA: TIGR02450 family Trp-rich protein [Vibrio parahaemolyticus]|uniref:TIGR02450 family Trp-rich protein n=1 Tax=Vibrio parahaemolyticus TaxID=670 RepID=UPI0023629D70|nr:TIGR02450 family Trp-rich protein [Vibrio parahaemolyticus]MDF5343430.1 TIGR02450 family Trp-rich protein [Vibrio parahaemolyticus]HCH4279606.1 TIGR02450 family Trp-rich protein [Vibrio parahaemolyticus]
MNKIHPKKLLHSKWTATSPKNKEKHFVVTEMELDEDGNVGSNLGFAVDESSKNG